MILPSFTAQQAHPKLLHFGSFDFTILNCQRFVWHRRATNLNDSICLPAGWALYLFTRTPRIFCWAWRAETTWHLQYQALREGLLSQELEVYIAFNRASQSWNCKHLKRKSHVTARNFMQNRLDLLNAESKNYSSCYMRRWHPTSHLLQYETSLLYVTGVLPSAVSHQHYCVKYVIS